MNTEENIKAHLQSLHYHAGQVLTSEVCNEEDEEEIYDIKLHVGYAEDARNQLDDLGVSVDKVEHGSIIFVGDECKIVAEKLQNDGMNSVEEILADCMMRVYVACRHGN